MPPLRSDLRAIGQRRRNLTIALVLAVAILGGALVTAVVVGDPPRRESQADQDGAAEKPRMVPQPGSGRAPDEAGDRGGWGQLLVFCLIVVGIAVLVALAWRSSVRARRATRRLPPWVSP